MSRPTIKAPQAEAECPARQAKQPMDALPDATSRILDVARLRRV